jgi:hypothetical protein
MTSGDDFAEAVTAWGIVAGIVAAIVGVVYVGEWVAWVLLGVGLVAFLVWLMLPAERTGHPTYEPEGDDLGDGWYRVGESETTEQVEQIGELGSRTR